MKATGIVRRIDDLGRVVIPKEIRKTLRIREGDPLEIYVDRTSEVILKKYSPVAELGGFAQEYVDSLFENNGKNAIIVDRDTVIAAAGPLGKDLLGKGVIRQMERIMEERAALLLGPGLDEELELIDEERNHWPVKSLAVASIIAAGDPVGIVIIATTAEEPALVSDVDLKLVKTAAGFLGRQLES